MVRTIDDAHPLPATVWGRRVRPTPGSGTVVEAPAAAVTVPALTPELADELAGVDRRLLADVPLQEIVSFLTRAGRQWKDKEYARRQLYVTQLVSVLGYSPAAAAVEADWLGILLDAKVRMVDMVAAELGSPRALEEWLPSEDAHVRAFPRGLVVHLLPGNVPLSCGLSLVRALLTKNVSILKASSRDPVTPAFVALSLADVDAAHPVARAVSAVHWRHDDPAGARLVGTADAVCAWGGRVALDAARRLAPAEAPLSAFGPKRSFAVIGAAADLDHAARGLAHDVASYDQAACFSTQRVFVEGDADPLVDRLGPLLDEYETLLPPPARSIDADARVALDRLEHAYLGDRVEWSPGGHWTLVVCPPDRLAEHPLARTLYIHPIARLADVHRFADTTVQTVAFLPWDLALDHRDALARQGVSRFVEVGLSNLFRVGGSHDGRWPLRDLVRIVSTDAPSAVYGKGMLLQMNQTELLREGGLTTYEL